MTSSRQVQRNSAKLSPIEVGILHPLNLEIVMNRQSQTAARRAPRFTVDDIGLFLTIGIFGLLPVGTASGMMLMQILGVWEY
jgi:hypothetical protein